MVIISAVTREDLDSFLKLAEAIFIPTYSQLFPIEEVQELFKGMFKRELILDAIDSNSKDLFFAEIDSERVGFCLLIHKGSTTRIDKIYVLPQVQGKGIGKALMDHIAKCGQKRKTSQLELNVNVGNTKAIQFYKNQGFKVIREEDFHAPNGVIYRDFVLKKAF
jgi:ribosomal protein S18 acetylase RimI-like enzyme